MRRRARPFFATPVPLVFAFVALAGSARAQRAPGWPGPPRNDAAPDATTLPPVHAVEASEPPKAASDAPDGASPTEAAAPAADAQESVPFGRAGQIVLTGSFGLSASSSSYSTGDAANSDARVAPSVDIFVIDGLSLGVELEYTHAVDQGYAANGAVVRSERNAGSGGVRVGYAVPLADGLSWWPRLTLGYAVGRTTVDIVKLPPTADGWGVVPDSAYADTTDDKGAYLSAFAPLVLRAAPRFVLGFGPTFARDLGRSYASSASTRTNDATTIGAALLIGGWL